jgi:hypothetical protein
MSTMIPGVVHDGKVVPETPLPDGLNVQIVVPEYADTEEMELQEEMAAWRAGTARALERVEELADQEGQDAKG